MENWYRHWFESEEYLNVYRHRDEQEAVKLVDTLVSILDLPKSGKILDAACGAGRHSIPLAQKGFRVTGFDLSMTLLKLAVGNSKRSKVKVDYVNADIREVCFNEKFDVITNLFTSFGYFNSDEENFTFVRKSGSMLKKGGYFILDFFNKFYLLNNLIPSSKKRIGDKFIVENRFLKNGRVEKEIIVEESNSKKKFIESVKLYSKDELVSAFKSAGFSLHNIIGDYDGTNFDERNSERLILIFNK